MRDLPHAHALCLREHSYHLTPPHLVLGVVMGRIVCYLLVRILTSSPALPV